MMKKISVIILLLVLSASSVAFAGERSRFSVKVYFSGKRYGSDEGFETKYFAAEGDNPSLFDTRCQMKYHYDNKWGVGFGLSLCYAVGDNLELDCGFGYTSIRMEISQKLRCFYKPYIDATDSYYSLSEFSNADDYDYDTFSIRPGLNLYVSSNPTFRPYIGARLDVRYIRADANLLFARPYVVEEGGQYDLFIGYDSDFEYVHINDSQMLIGIGLESGMEFMAEEGISIGFGFFYDIHPRKAFADFGNTIEDDEQRSEIKDIGYNYEGMEFSTIGVFLSLKYNF
jgi:hypothetical protein